MGQAKSPSLEFCIPNIQWLRESRRKRGRGQSQRPRIPRRQLQHKAIDFRSLEKQIAEIGEGMIRDVLEEL